MYEKAKLLLTLTTAISRGDPCTRYFWVVRLLARRCRAALVVTLLFAAGCAPTFESHIDQPAAMRTLDSQPSATQCTSTEKKEKEIAPLDPRPQLPDAYQSPCPDGSGLGACFTPGQEIVRQQRFKILHDDRDYCRDAYERAVKRVSQ